jgi:UDP-N-acetylglucosamine 2-epimerase (non-hydrolysing)
MVKVIHIVGTRPNFVKIAPIIEEMNKIKEIKQLLVHTGQHYDKNMCKLFFEDLGLFKPDIDLGVRFTTQVDQIRQIMLGLEKILLKEKPDLVVVVGDVSSTLAGALAAKKLNIKLAHVESGLRSFDLTMPEEVNRIIIDSISDILFTTEERANKNLINEGIKEEKIFFVGNAMIDSLLKHRELADKSDILEKSGLIRKKYCVLTLHRPSNVDNPESFNKVVDIIHEIQKKVKIIFPIHPRTRNNIKSFGLTDAVSKMKNLILVEPLGYLDFLKLISNAMFVLTDSGGIQEETTILNVPCITLRDNTERHVTCEKGTNMLVSTKKEEIVNAVNTILENKFKSNGTPEKWDGNSTKRIVKVILDQIQ